MLTRPIELMRIGTYRPEASSKMKLHKQTWERTYATHCSKYRKLHPLFGHDSMSAWLATAYTQLVASSNVAAPNHGAKELPQSREHDLLVKKADYLTPATKHLC